MSQELTTEQVHELLKDQVGEKIELLEAEMLKHIQLDIPVIHGYKEGMYTREIVIPKGTLLTGRVHKYDYIDIMLSGDISVATAEGVKRLSGHNVLDGKAGRKRAGYAHEDTYWITVHNIPEKYANENYLDSMTFFSLKEYKVYREKMNMLIQQEAL